VPEIAFTGDTSGELFEKNGSADIYRAKLLIVECTFVDDSVTWEQVGPLRVAVPTDSARQERARLVASVRCCLRHALRALHDYRATLLSCVAGQRGLQQVLFAQRMLWFVFVPAGS
jgi:DNA-binding PucR family transcriptional regulator